MNDCFRKVRRPLGKVVITILGVSLLYSSTAYATDKKDSCSYVNNPLNYILTTDSLVARRALSRGKSNLDTLYKTDLKKDAAEIDLDNTVSVASTTSITVNKESTAHLPIFFLYKEINEQNIKDYLKDKNSLLAEEPYFSQIISTSRNFNLNPLILFAITGQEQSFVPKHQKNAHKIANNPFNVFYSWQSYNTNITDASEIVSRTIINLSKDRPNNVDPFTWLNRKYAGDPNWATGVRNFYSDLSSINGN